MPKTVRQTSLGLYGVYIAEVGVLDENVEWRHVSDTLQGTASITQDDAELTEIFVEESDLPIESNEKAGVRKFQGSIPDLSFDVLNTYFGATVESAVQDGENVERVAMPDSSEAIYYMFKFVPKSGAKALIFTKGKVSAKVNGNMSADETLNVDIVVTSLKSDIEGQNGFYIDLPQGVNPGYFIGQTLDENALDNLIAPITDGSLSLTIDSATVAKSGNITFAGATSWDDIIGILNSHFPTATFSIDEEEYRMLVTSKTTGSASNVSLNAWDTVGTDLSLAANLALAGGDAVVGS